MQVVVRGKNLEVTAALREYVEKKVSKLERFVDGPLSAQVQLYVERGRHIAEVTAGVNGLVLRGEEAQQDMYASIDLVVDKLEKQVQKYKTRLRRRGKEQAASEVLPAAESGDLEDGTVVKRKSFNVKPLGVEEAIMQMNLVGHDFFVFQNAENERVCVVYKRKDGNYGLLEPEV